MHAALTRLRQPIAAFLALAALALMVAACGSSGSTGTKSAATPSAVGKQVAPTNLRVELDDKVLTLDPDLAGDFNSLAVMHLIAGTLFTLGADGKPQPFLAQSAVQSPDHLAWTFTLRPNLHFSNGAPLTAADVVATLQRSKQDPDNAYAVFYTPINQVQLLSPTRLRVTTKRPYPSLPTIMTGPEFAVLPRSALPHPTTAYFRAPIYAGPYKLTQLTPNRVVLSRNPHYAGAPPGPQTITFTPITDGATRLNEVLAGQQDFDPDLAANLASQAGSALHVAHIESYGFANIITNNRRSPFNQLGVRRAVSLALNRDQMVNVLFGGHNRAISSFWPSTYPGYNPALQQQSSNVTAAKAALKGTTCANGCSFTLVYSPYPAFNVSFVQIYAQQLAAIGIHVHLDEVDFATTQALVSQPSKFQAMTINLYDFTPDADGLATWGLLPLPAGYDADFSYFVAPSSVRAAVAKAIATPSYSNLNAVNLLFNKYQPYTTLFDQTILTASRYADSVVHMTPSQFIQVGSSG